MNRKLKIGLAVTAGIGFVIIGNMPPKKVHVTEDGPALLEIAGQRTFTFAKAGDAGTRLFRDGDRCKTQIGVTPRTLADNGGDAIYMIIPCSRVAEDN